MIRKQAVTCRKRMPDRRLICEVYGDEITSSENVSMIVTGPFTERNGLICVNEQGSCNTVN